MQPLNGIGGPRRAPLAWRQAGEGEQLIARFLQTIGHGAMLQPPLAQEGAPARLDLARALGVDHVRIVGRDLLMQFLHLAYVKERRSDAEAESILDEAIQLLR